MEREQRRMLIIQACIDHQKSVADIARHEMCSAQQQSNDYGANVDRYDSYRTKMLRIRDMYAKQLSNANASIRVLQELLRLAPMQVADHGAIVITNKQNFLLGVGIGKFLVSSETSGMDQQKIFYAISAQSPVSMALKGKRVGDVVIFNGVTQEIIEIL